MDFMMTLFDIAWYLVLGASLLLAALWRGAGRMFRFRLPPPAAGIGKAVLAILCGFGLTGSYLSLIPANETFTYNGGMAPVSEKFPQERIEDTSLYYVYVRNGYLQHEGQRFLLNLFRFRYPNLIFEPQEGTAHAYRTAEEDLIVGRNAQKESYDNMYIAAFDYLNRPLHPVVTYEIITTYAMFKDATEKLRSGDIILSYDGIPKQGRAELDRYIREQKPSAITYEILRDGKKREVTVALYDPFGYGGYHAIGFAIGEKKQYELPDDALKIPEEITHSGGSSGMMMALQIISHISGEPLARGRRIAGTGGITADGRITAIGSLYHKVATVYAHKAELFLVPKEQEQEALRYRQMLRADSLPIVGVGTIAEAVETIRSFFRGETR